MDPAYQELLDRLRRLVDPDADGDPSFVRWVVSTLEAMPRRMSPLDPYVGDFPPAADWVEGFERIPSAGRDEHCVVEAAVGAFSGVMRAESLSFLHNITPPVVVPAAALGAAATLCNPNALWDLVSGGVLNLERQLARQVARLAGWDPSSADGVTTFGGKAGLIYAVRLGLNRCLPETSVRGLARSGQRPVVLTTDQNHYTIRSVCSLLGLGADAVVELPTDCSGRMVPEEFVRHVLDAHRRGLVVAAVVLCGGNTLDAVVDPIRRITSAIDSERIATRLGYRPWVHVDLPVGWPWLFFRSYDPDENRLGLPSEGLRDSMRVADALDGIERADSLTVDFHKLGFCPYQASLFVARSWQELRSGVRQDEPPAPAQPFGENPMQQHTIEHSRSSAPVLTAWATLQMLGADGFRTYLAHCHAITASLRRCLARDGLTVLNPSTPSLATLVTAHPEQDHTRPETWSQLVGSDQYVEGLYRHVSGLDGSVRDPLALGFVPGYRPPGSTRAAQAAIRWYVANPLLDETALAHAVTRFIDLKRSYDLDARTDDEMPPLRMSHTPR